jgi:hypothetical protein
LGTNSVGSRRGLTSNKYYQWCNEANCGAGI